MLMHLTLSKRKRKKAIGCDVRRQQRSVRKAAHRNEGGNCRPLSSQQNNSQLHFTQALDTV
jgi:hypothetical protein